MIVSAAGAVSEAMGVTLAAIAGFLVGLPAWPLSRHAGGGGSMQNGAPSGTGAAAWDELLGRLVETIRSNSLLLFGGLRLSRTSVLQELRRLLRTVDECDNAYFPVYVDLHRTPETRFFATLARGVFEELAGPLGGLEPAVEFESGEYGYRELVGDLRRVVRRLSEATDKRVRLVLLLDGVDELNGYDPRVNQKLRSLFMKSFAEHLVAVVSGVGIRRAWEREGSPWFNFFEEIEVRLAAG